MERGHQLVRRVERQLGDPRVPLPGGDRVDAALGGQHDQRALSRVADQLAVFDHRVRGQHHRHQELIQRDVRLPGDPGDTAGGRVALPVDRIPTARGHHLDGGHLVQGERAGLVCIDRRGGAEGLGRRQAFHDRAGFGEHLGPVGEDDCDHHGQRHRDRGDGKGDSGVEDGDERVAAGQVQRHRRDQREACDHQDLLRQPVHLAGERGLDVLFFLQHPGDVADLGRHPGRRDHELARTARDFGVHVHHAGPVAEGRVGVRHGAGGLGDGQALPGQRGLGDLQPGRSQQPPVRRHDVARLDRDDIAGHQLLGGDLGQLAIPSHPGLDDHHLPKGGDGRGGLPLLPQAHDRVEQRQQDQQEARAELPERVQAADAGRKQHDLHRVAVLAEERVPAGLGLARGELVQAKPLGPGGHLSRAQATLPVCPFEAEDLVGAERVPRRLAGRRRPSRSWCFHRPRSHAGCLLPSSDRIRQPPGPVVVPMYPASAPPTRRVRVKRPAREALRSAHEGPCAGAGTGSFVRRVRAVGRYWPLPGRDTLDGG